MSSKSLLLNLKHIKDWNIDLSTELESYLLSLDEPVEASDDNETIDFIEAAMIIQGSSIVYSKKVELLHELAFHALRHLSLNEEAEVGEERTSSRQPRASQQTLHAKLDAFEPLDDFFPPPAAVEMLPMPRLNPRDPTLLPRVPEALVSFNKLVQDAYKTERATNGIEIPRHTLGQADDEFKLANIHADLATGALTIQEWATAALEEVSHGGMSQPVASATPFRPRPRDARERPIRDSPGASSSESDDAGPREVPATPRPTQAEPVYEYTFMDPYDPGAERVRPFKASVLPTVQAIARRMEKMGAMHGHCTRTMVAQHAKVARPLSNDSDDEADAAVPFEDFDDIAGEPIAPESGGLGVTFAGIDSDSDSDSDDHVGPDGFPTGYTADMAEDMDARIAAYWEKAREYTATDEVTRRVSAWSSRMAGLLEEEYARPTFDAHELGAGMIASLTATGAGKRAMGGPRLLEDLAGSREPQEISRAFAALLFLLNKREVDVEKRGETIEVTPVD
ncbi:Non-SMC condensin II complex subunit H2-like [Carpediemonas membranifera]|uniref:Non-SMC condensin II complex subunit H2-like n=1 Tax=Carpediemonas membranifera TaxID=201153 RepID=A0A8J6E191_9EUKA|nr:Non-SMC condensin II complex subunit H2-like [Carpediemonas membranifera]|eukprot:KAG9393173.1 Non-SMC condensin II complex subunit H2-like [Carpediemonas membranifera]